MAASLTKRSVDALTANKREEYLWDDDIRGFGVKALPTGRKVFLLVYRYPRGRAGKVRRYTIGAYGDLTVDQARRIAVGKRGDVARGIDPMAELEHERKVAEAVRKAPRRSVAHIAEEFIERYAKKRNRTWRETERILKRHVIPAWGRRQITEITRADVNELLDGIEDASGAPMATAVLAQVRKLFNWHATRDDKFNSPIVKGMGRISPKSMARDRVLSDDEIRLLWGALEQSPPPYRQLVRFLLLTAQRRDEAANAQVSEIAHGVWTIPAERSKNKQANLVPLSALARKQIEDLAVTQDRRFVFTTTGAKPFSGFSKAKRRLDAEMNRLLQSDATNPHATRPHLEPWRLHDLRRTAKTLMQRCGVRPDISERVLGHAIPGVEGVYDRHQYLEEKRHALEALSTELRQILEGAPTKNVANFRPRARS